MKRFVDKLAVSRGTRHAMLLGAVMGTVFAWTGASAPVIYGVGLAAGVALCLLEDGMPGGGPFRRNFWRRR
jgi:hypothetical protein